jgi:hypothetical protein
MITLQFVTRTLGDAMRLSRPLILMTGSLLGALVTPVLAHAHDLITTLTIGPNDVKVEAGYDDDTPAEKAKVWVTDSTGAAVARGVLDERGVWVFPRPGPGRYEVEVQIAGHRDIREFVIPGGEPQDQAPVTVTSWRLDKRLGAAIGLAVIALVTLAVWLARRKPNSSSVP